MKGILFKPDMIKAIIEGRKTQTRRIIKPQPEGEIDEMCKTTSEGWQTLGHSFQWTEHADTGNHIWKPKYLPGETVYLKEAIILHTHGTPIRYTDGLPAMVNGASLNPDDWKWRGNKLSPMFLPEIFARYFLKIISVRPERLQEITKHQEDAIAEGVLFMGGIADNFDEAPWCASIQDQEPMKYPSAAYGRLWNSINGVGSWEKNPWVWRYEFEVKK